MPGEIYFRLGIFLSVFVLMASWETFAEKRLNPGSRRARWPGNFGLIILDNLSLRLAFPAAAIGAALLAEKQPQLLSPESAQASLQVRTSTGDSVDLYETATRKAKMVFFYSDHCPVCSAMEGFLPAVEKSCAQTEFQLFRVNVDLAENQQAASRFQVRATPTIALLTGSGTEIVHLVGYQTQGRLLEAAKTATQVACAGTKESGKDLELPSRHPFRPGQFCGDGKAC